MPKKFPEKLPPKGEGRVDNKHRVALLTEPEIGALNFLKNMDRAMGYKSGFSPMMQNLAAKNTQPLEYVEYRGERIPSLNDFSEGGYGGGGDRGSDAGEREGREASGSESDWARRQRLAAQERQRKIKEENDWVNEQIRKRNERREQRRRNLEAMNADYHDQNSRPDSETLDDEEQDRLSELGYGGRGEGGEGLFEYPGSYGGGEQHPDYAGRGEGEQNYGQGGEPYVPDYEDDGDGDNPYGLTPQYQAHDGSMHWSQESADAENALLLDELRASREQELYDYGGTASEEAYTDLESDFQTYLDATLAGQRQTAYDQALSGLYEDQKQSGVWDQDTYDTALAGIDAGVLADETRLGQYEEELKTSAKEDYDTWLQDQLSDLSGQGYQDLQDWNWSDLDLSSHTDNQEYQDFNFLDEFKKLDPEGNVVGTDTGEEVDSAGVEAVPASRTAIKKKKKYTPTSSSSALTGSGSSTNIG